MKRVIVVLVIVGLATAVILIVASSNRQSAQVETAAVFLRLVGQCVQSGASNEACGELVGGALTGYEQEAVTCNERHPIPDDGFTGCLSAAGMTLPF